MEKINIAELLKDCPKGMELDCTMYDKFILVGVDNDLLFPIKVMRKDGCLFTLTKYGQYCNSDYAKCIIFPKGKTTWEEFTPHCQFKDGDIVTSKDDGLLIACIYKRKNKKSFNHHTAIYKGCLGVLVVNGELALTDDKLRFATEEEKQKLFDAIKANGYKWNTETKTLDKLVEPKFKVGDRITLKNCNDGKPIYKITKVKNDCYETDQGELPFYYEDSWKLVPNKFDINTLKPFDKVLVRDNNKQEWVISLFSHCNGLEIYKYSCINGSWYSQCIPYEGNQHLLGKTDNCVEYFKTWE